jgi:hypothetical protein
VFVAVSITETLLLYRFVIYAHGAVVEALCTVAADTVEEIKIKNKIRAADAKTTE